MGVRAGFLASEADGGARQGREDARADRAERTLRHQVPTAAQLQLTQEVGSHSLASRPDKLRRAGVELFSIDGHDAPFVAGCSAWLACTLVREPHNQQAYDLFIGEVDAAWSDTRAFKNGRWQFEQADPAWRSLHHVAGGHFYAIGEALSAREADRHDAEAAL